MISPARKCCAPEPSTARVDYSTEGQTASSAPAAALQGRTLVLVQAAAHSMPRYCCAAEVRALDAVWRPACCDFGGVVFPISRAEVSGSGSNIILYRPPPVSLMPTCRPLQHTPSQVCIHAFTSCAFDPSLDVFHRSCVKLENVVSRGLCRIYKSELLCFICVGEPTPRERVLQKRCGLACCALVSWSRVLSSHKICLSSAASAPAGFVVCSNSHRCRYPSCFGFFVPGSTCSPFSSTWLVASFSFHPCVSFGACSSSLI